MVEQSQVTPLEENQQNTVATNQQKVNPILKPEGAVHRATDRVKFDEEELTEYDKTRGQKMKINDPKTPYELEQIELAEKQEIAENEKIDQETADSLKLA